MNKKREKLVALIAVLVVLVLLCSSCSTLVRLPLYLITDEEPVIVIEEPVLI